MRITRPQATAVADGAACVRDALTPHEENTSHRDYLQGVEHALRWATGELLEVPDVVFTAAMRAGDEVTVQPAIDPRLARQPQVSDLLRQAIELASPACVKLLRVLSGMAELDEYRAACASDELQARIAPSYHPAVAYGAALAREILGVTP